MRVFIIGNDGITLCRKPPATVNDGEIAVASNEELHAAPLSGKRLLALWNALPGVEKRKKVGGRKDRLRGPDLAGLDGEIAGLVDRSTQELRRAWRTLHHTGPPLGFSRDLIIRGLADKLQKHAHGGPSRALQRRLQILAGEFEKGV